MKFLKGVSGFAGNAFFKGLYQVAAKRDQKRGVQPFSIQYGGLHVIVCYMFSVNCLLFSALFFSFTFVSIHFFGLHAHTTQPGNTYTPAGQNTATKV